jgi:CheY-like chemotaxis protein
LVNSAPDGLTFLILDDSEDTRFLHRRQLEDEFPASHVIECETICAALAASAGQPVDAVITDHHLGESDGAEFVQLLRAQGHACPVLMVTGSSDPRVHERAYQAGATRVFFGSKLDFVPYLRTQLSHAEG